MTYTTTATRTVLATVALGFVGLSAPATSTETPEPVIVIVEVPAPAAAETSKPAAPAISPIELEPVLAYSFEADRTAHQDMLNTYSTAGHTAPEFDLRFHDNAEGCMGYHGLHVVTTDGRTTVNVCYTHERPVMQDGMRARTLLHESAHAWVNQNVSEAQIDEFMTVRGLTVWEGSEAEWSALGAEHAAEILMWGMTDGTYMITPRIDSSDSDNLRAAYGILIGA